MACCEYICINCGDINRKQSCKCGNTDSSRFNVWFDEDGMHDDRGNDDYDLLDDE